MYLKTVDDIESHTINKDADAGPWSVHTYSDYVVLMSRLV